MTKTNKPKRVKWDEPQITDKDGSPVLMPEDIQDDLVEEDEDFGYFETTY